jgi:EAL and modified HD-GYP domain-containing signal transduction protein
LGERRVRNAKVEGSIPFRSTISHRATVVSKLNDSSGPVMAQVARQPIFNGKLEIIGYELLYRAPGATSAQITDATAATATVIVGVAMDIGLAQLVGDKPAYINFPHALLINPRPLPMQPKRIVVEVLEDVKPDREILAGLAALRQQGYRIALDDYNDRAGSLALLDAADIVKIDIQDYSSARLKDCVERVRLAGPELIAEKVETWEQFSLCKSLGFQGYQGYLLERPQIVTAQRAPTSRLATLKLMIELSDPDVAVPKIERMIAGDVGMSYRLLRCINSSFYHLPRVVSSVRQAVVLIGLNELRKLCAAVTLAGFDDQPGYVPVQALVRAKMCEDLCIAAGLRGSEGYFMTGLLSMVDVLLQQPLEQALGQLPLSAQVQSALLEHKGSLGEALRCSLDYERARWDSASFMSLSEAAIANTYQQAVVWADTAWRNIGGGT